MNAAADKRRPVCGACGDCGLIYPPKGSRGSLASLPARAMPLPCSLCDAGALELRTWHILSKVGAPTPEIEIFKFRKAKG